MHGSHRHAPRFGVAAIVAMVGVASPALTAPKPVAPSVTRLTPADGETDVAPGALTLEVIFDRPMGPGITINSDNMPTVLGVPGWDSTRRVLRVPVRVEAGTSYRLELNSPTDLGFASSAGVPLAPRRWRFRTSGAPRVSADSAALEARRRRLAAIPSEQVLGTGPLRVFNLWSRQADILAGANPASPESTVERLVREVYEPHRALWNAYLGDAATFRTWATERLLDPAHPIALRIDDVLALKLDEQFVEATRWIESATGLVPRGRWTLVFGHGATDMGGLGDGGMLMDFTHQVPDAEAIAALLPHELTHQVHGDRGRDPNGGTVLERVVAEGLGCYAAYVHGGGRVPPHRCLGYSEEQWRWALAHERELAAAARPLLSSRRRADLDRIASRSERLLPEGPPAAGYFLGFRLLQSLARHRGDRGWIEALRMPVRRVLSTSGYRL